MLDQKVFLQGINYLKANYLNWGFDLNNDLMLKVWYKKFSNLEPSVFMGLLEKYTELHKFPPNSPAELLDLLRDHMAQRELTHGEAWEEVIKLIHRYGFYYGREKIYEALEDKPALLKTVREFEGELRGLQVDDSYTPERFKKAYAINLKRQVENNSCLLLGTSNLFLLE
jgi:hypothetical protein